MTGKPNRVVAAALPKPISPSPMPVPGREEKEAKKKARKGARGRASTILAGRMMASRNDILKTRLG
ncbi:MAG: hypothetical protein ACYSSI_00085 [Planctomycetota bacterium]|jgi:hypothetical protein